MRRTLFLLIITIGLGLLTAPVAGQDGFNLPAALYALGSDGQVQRFGLGTEGVRTVTPEDAFVLDFGVSPDGNWLAYRTEDALSVTHLFLDNSAIVETNAGVPPVRGQGDTLAWSPTGDTIAYTTLNGIRVHFNSGLSTLEDETKFADITVGEIHDLRWSPDGRFLAAAANDNIWWIYRRDEPEMTLVSAIPSSIGLDWLSGGELIFAPQDGGLFAMNLDNANAQTTLLDDTWFYRLPFRRPDGTIVVFARQKGDDTIEEGFGRLIALLPDEAAIGNLSETAIEIEALRWMPRGEFLTAFQGGVLAVVEPTTGNGFPLPISNAVAFGWGSQPFEHVEGVQLPREGYFLAEDENEVVQLWRLPADGSPPFTITDGEDDVTSYGISPGGRNVAYSSGGTLWLRSADGRGEARQLATINAENLPDPAFSPDGQQIAYADGGIWMISTNGDAPQQLAANRSDGQSEVLYARPQFATNLGALLVDIVGGDGVAPGILDVNTGEVLGASCCFSNSRWLRDGRFITYSVNTDPLIIFAPGLQLWNVNSLSEPAILLPDLVSVSEVVEVEPGVLRIVIDTGAQFVSPLRVVDMRIEDGVTTFVSAHGFAEEPTLSPGGDFIAGFAGTNVAPGVVRGSLTLIDNMTGEQVILSEPKSVWDFKWRPN